jgi:hypothetical protein
MSDETTPETLDLEDYRENSQALIESMNQTTELMESMSTNMSHLSECFESFGETRTQLRDAQAEMEADGDTPTRSAGSMTGAAAD